MRNHENKIYELFKKWKREHNSFDDLIKFHRIETGNTELAVPDLYFRLCSKTGWIEMKYIKWPKRKNTLIRPKWRPGQFQWIIQHNRFTSKKVSEAFLAVIDEKQVIRIFSKDRIFHEYSQEQFMFFGKRVYDMDMLLQVLK